MSMVKFSVFSDLHYREGNWNWAEERLEQILDRAVKAGSQFIMHCGDFCHNINAAKNIIELYNNFSIPTYHTMGNHDFEESSDISDVCKAFKMGCKSHYSFEISNIRFISLDSNFFHDDDGKLCHYASASTYAKCHQVEQSLSPEELEFLDHELDLCKGTAVIFSHSSVNKFNGITNRNEAKEIIFRHPDVPVLWINGHFHRNSLAITNNLAVFDLNSTTSDWINTPHNGYPKELMEKFHLSNHVLLYDTPVHATVTVSDDGEIKIEGMDGNMYLGVTRETTGNPIYDSNGLPCDASVLSAHFKICTSNLK